MKKLTIILAILFAVNASAQSKPAPNVVAADTTKTIAGIPDSIASISVWHVGEAMKRLTTQLASLEDKLTVTEYKRVYGALESAFNELINVATEDYKKRKKPVK